MPSGKFSFLSCVLSERLRPVVYWRTHVFNGRTVRALGLGSAKVIRNHTAFPTLEAASGFRLIFIELGTFLTVVLALGNVVHVLNHACDVRGRRCVTPIARSGPFDGIGRLQRAVRECFER